MFKNKVDTSQEGGLHVDENCCTLDKPMASLSTCHPGLWLGWQILLKTHLDSCDNQQTVCACVHANLYHLSPTLLIYIHTYYTDTATLTHVNLVGSVISPVLM